MLTQRTFSRFGSNASFGPKPTSVMFAANDGFGLILLKNNVLQMQKVAVEWEVERLSDQAVRGFCGAGKILASLRRFWAVAARRNSSFAPHGPRNRRRPRPRMRLRWANSISTFFRNFIEMSYCFVLAMSRAICLASSCSSRVMDRASMLGQQCAFDGQVWHVSFSARYFAPPLPVGPLFGSE